MLASERNPNYCWSFFLIIHVYYFKLCRSKTILHVNLNSNIKLEKFCTYLICNSFVDIDKLYMIRIMHVPVNIDE